MRIAKAVLAALLLTLGASAQQVADPDFNPEIAQPAYPSGKGPVVAIDEAHNNFHTADGRYLAFAQLLRRDGYRVRASRQPFSAESLAGVDVLVIANALPPAPPEGVAPRLPLALAVHEDEAAVLRRWVEQGGALLLIADHKPFPGTVRSVAAELGVEWHDGYVLTRGMRGIFAFTRDDGSLATHPVTAGRSEAEKIDSVTTFTGSAFRAQSAQPILVLGKEHIALTPDAAVNEGRITEETPRMDVDGWLQGATLRLGKGRVALFGEAAMFSAQLAGAQRTPMGMNAPGAAQNPQFLLNVMHWLSGLLGEGD